MTFIRMPPSSQDDLEDDEDEGEMRPPWHERKIMNEDKPKENKNLPILSMPILVGEDQSQNIEPAVNTSLTNTTEDLLCQVDFYDELIMKEKEKLATKKSSLFSSSQT